MKAYRKSLTRFIAEQKKQREVLAELREANAKAAALEVAVAELREVRAKAASLEAAAAKFNETSETNKRDAETAIGQTVFECVKRLAASAKLNPVYDSTTRKEDGGLQVVLRFDVPENKETVLQLVDRCCAPSEDTDSASPASAAPAPEYIQITPSMHVLEDSDSQQLLAAIDDGVAKPPAASSSSGSGSAAAAESPAAVQSLGQAAASSLSAAAVFTYADDTSEFETGMQRVHYKTSSGRRASGFRTVPADRTVFESDSEFEWDSESESDYN